MGSFINPEEFKEVKEEVSKEIPKDLLPSREQKIEDMFAEINLKLDSLAFRLSSIESKISVR